MEKQVGLTVMVSVIHNSLYLLSPTMISGNPKQIAVQLLGVVVAAVWASAVTYFLIKVIAQTVGVKVSEDTEAKGLDLVEHKASAYDLMANIDPAVKTKLRRENKGRPTLIRRDRESRPLISVSSGEELPEQSDRSQTERTEKGSETSGDTKS